MAASFTIEINDCDCKLAIIPKNMSNLNQIKNFNRDYISKHSRHCNAV